MKKFTVILTVMLALTCTIFAERQTPTKNVVGEWTILQSWDISGKASGLAYDGTYLYYGIYGSDGDHVYRFDPSDGSTQLQFTNPTINDCHGMTWDGSNLWITNQASSSSDPASAIELDLSGTILSTFDLPDHYMSGIAYDAGDFWVGTYYPNPGTIYNVDNGGSIISQFTPPTDQIWDICKQDDELWMVDYDADMIYKTDQSGSVIESHASENIKPSGIVFDGTFLWYVDGQTSSPSKLYKVDLSGAGTPEITIPVSSHNYGTVTTGTSDTWNMLVQNTGQSDLEITDLVIPGTAPISSTFNPPQVITPGGSLSIPLTYTPTTVSSLDVTIVVESTDPLTPSVDISLIGEAVNPGPSLLVTFDEHNYGDVRATAFTRWFLELNNIGDATLVINGISSDQPVYIIDESVSFPINIAPLNSVQIGIWFNPLEEANYVAELTIDNNDPANDPYSINLEGYGIEQEWLMGEPLWSYLINTPSAYDNSPKAIAPIKDITGDNVDDVIICSEDNYIRCFNGNSSGIADVIWEVEVYSGNVYDQPGLTIIEDIDGDGYEDIIVGTTGGDRSIIAFSGKTGNQIWKHYTNEYGNGGWVYSVEATHDYNNDGITDILASTGDDGEDNGPLRVYCLNALDGISIWEKYLGGPVFSVIGADDFTGDGVPDVIAGAANADETEGRVYGINGSNGNITWTKATGGSSVWALLQLDDITGDGIKDIIAGDFGGNYYYINPVDNTQIFQGSIYGSLILRFEKLNDINNDGYSDVLVAHSKPNGIVLNGFDGSNVWFKTIADKSWNVAPIDDLDGDGINDVIIGTLYSNNYGYFINGLDGEEFESISYPIAIDAINAIPDIVGDETMEMVVGGRSGQVYCYSGGNGLNVAIHENEELQTKDASNVYPNPFYNRTTISFSLEEASLVMLRIYDLSGKIVNELINQNLSSGTHNVIWNGKDMAGKELPAAFYIYEIKTNKGNLRRKIAKIK